MVVSLSFEKFLDDDAGRSGFGSSRYVRNFKERQNISKVALDSDSGCRYLDPGENFTAKYSEFRGQRYIGCLALTFDVALTVYDDNSQSIFASRFVAFTQQVQLALTKWMRSIRRPNFEARMIGLQNKQASYPSNLLVFIRRSGLRLFEIDVFGDEVRHVAFDVKDGLSFDILVNNRLYKPGELINKTTLEQFERAFSAQTQISKTDVKRTSLAKP